MINKNNFSALYYIKRYRFNSIFIKYFSAIMVLIVIPLLVLGAFIYNYSNATLNREIYSKDITELNIVKSSIDAGFEQANQVSLNFLNDKNAEIFLLSEQDDIDTFDKIINFRNLKDNLNTAIASSNFIDSIYIYSEKSGYVLSSNNITSGFVDFFGEMGWFENYLNIKDSMDIYIYHRSLITNVTTGETQSILTFIRPIYIYGEKNGGAIVINIDTERLGAVIRDGENLNDRNFFIVDNKNNIICNKDSSLVGHKLAEYKKKIDNKNIVLSLDSKYGNMKYVSVRSLEFYNARINNIKRFIFIFSIGSILVVIVVSFFITVKAYQPLKNIISILDNPEEVLRIGEEEGIDKINEVKYIVNNISKTIDINHKMEEELVSRLAVLKKSQMEVLQYQINPHFLYNTLEAINWTAIGLTRSENDASKMITLLSELFSISLQDDSKLVTIEKEIAHAKLYINILQIRYKNKFEVIWDIDNEILQYNIVKLIFQPIIENAIYHGIQPSKKEGIIKIVGVLKDENILIEVFDSGKGIAPNEVKRINDELRSGDIQFDGHVGLKNVNQRISLIFGNEYGVFVSSKLGFGTTITILIPKLC